MRSQPRGGKASFYHARRVKDAQRTSMATALTVDTASGLIGVAASASAVVLRVLPGNTLRISAMEDSAIAQ